MKQESVMHADCVREPNEEPRVEESAVTAVACERRTKPVKVGVGGAWGDEGKGKLDNFLAKDADLVIRATGGANAGHTIVYHEQEVVLHLVPAGIVYPQTTCLIGQGTVIDMGILLDEIEMLEKLGVPHVRERIRISGRAHVVLKFHKDLDALYEKFKDKPVGTTGRGIGPAYADKMVRTGIRVYDLLLKFDKLLAKMITLVKPHNQLFELNGMSDAVVNSFALAAECATYGKQVENMVVNADLLVKQAYESGQQIVVEGAQAYRLDIDNGDYPNCTSSNCVTFGTLNGAHLSPRCETEVIVCAKAYSSRVGNGPFPTEQPAHVENQQVIAYDPDEAYTGDIIRELAHEYGATTKRPRRVGWLDCVVLRSAAWTLGADCLCLNHLDTIGKIGKVVGYIEICTAYGYQGRSELDAKIQHYPDDLELTGEMPMPSSTVLTGGWEMPENVQRFEDLPEKAKRFVEIVEKAAGIPVKYIGTGPRADDFLVRENTDLP